MTHSRKDYTGRNLQNEVFEEGEIVQGSCFAQERPDTVVFPEDMTGVTFKNCNLDNCVIPAGNTVIDCWQRRILVQPDGLDWIVDADNQPVEPF